MSAIVEGRAALLDYVEGRPAAAMALYCGVYFLAVVFSIPGGSVLTILGGIMFGGLVAGLVTTLVAGTGSLAVFLIARTALGDWTKRRAALMGPRVAGLAEGFRNNAFYVIVVLRLIPVMPYWASNAVPAMFNVRAPVFVAATLVGLLPWTVSFAFFGDALDEIVAAQELANPGCAAADTCEIDFTALTSGPVLTGLAIALLSLIPVGAHWLARSRKAKRQEAANQTEATEI
jgi:uncharacterized membrane protein YdjX (TVP38/TMEM64 family)